MVVELYGIGPSSSGSDEDSFRHSPPLQTKGQMRLLLTDHVIVATVLGFDRLTIRFEVHARELEFAFADFAVSLVGGDLGQLEAFGPEDVHLVGQVREVSLQE